MLVTATSPATLIPDICCPLVAWITLCLQAAAAAMRDSEITFSATAAAASTVASRTPVAAPAKAAAVQEPSHRLPAAAAAATEVKAVRVEDRLMDSSSSLTDGRTAGVAAAAAAGGSRQTGEFAGPATRLSAAQQQAVSASTAEGRRHQRRHDRTAVDEATQTAEPAVSTVAAAAGKKEFSQALGPLGGPEPASLTAGAMQEPARLTGAAAGARAQAEEVRGPPAVIAAPAAAAEMSEQMIVPASPVGGASVSSSTRERRHRHSLKHWRPHKAEVRSGFERVLEALL